jgi:predicted amidohydrolase YtcJ
MRAATSRSSASGRVLGPDERLTPDAALALFASPAEAPGAPPRRVASGCVADLCLLDRPWKDAAGGLSRGCVTATWVGGRLAWHRDA